MSEEEAKLPLPARIRWWLFDRCFAYCARFAYPGADPSEVSLLDNASFIAVSKDEIRKIIEEAPEVAWRFDSEAL